MRKKNTFLKRVFSMAMAVVITFTAASYDIHAEGLTNDGQSDFEYEFDNTYVADDISGTDDISAGTDISGTDNISDSTDVSETDAISDDTNSDESEPADVSAADMPDPAPEPAESILPEWFVPGYVHDPFEQPAGAVAKRRGDLRSTPIEAQYIPDDIPISLRNQNPYGTCWAFSSIALAELYMFKHYGMTPNYSELHLANFCYRPVIDPLGGTDGDISDSSWDILDGGGNNEKAGFTFASWRGVANEKKVPYNTASAVRANGLSETLAYDDAIHLRNFYDINIHENPEIVKKLVKENGGVALSFHAANGYSPETNSTVYNSANNCYYNPDKIDSNHAVTIVGWDDNFSKNKFSVIPETDGAWLIRNSWTTGSFSSNQSFSGYFWLSYCDRSIYDSAYAFTFDDVEKYDHNYQYDGIPLNACWSYGSKNTLTEANVFTAKACEGGEELKAVSFHSATPNFTAEIYVYKNPSDSKPNSGTLETSQTVNCEYPGYYTIDLAEPVLLDPGKKFSIVIKITADEKVQLGFEYGGGYYGYTAHADAGESFVSYNNGSTWTDFGKAQNANLRIKAFTCDAIGDAEITGITFKDNISSTGITLDLGDEYAVKTITTPYQVSNSKLTWTSSAESVATVSSSGVIKAVGLGTAVITASAPGGADCSVTVSVDNIPDIYLSCDGRTGSASVKRGNTLQFAVYTATGDNDVTDEATFSVSDSTIISVDDSGLVTALKAGSATLYADLGIKRASVNITVRAVAPTVTVSVTRDNTVTLSWPSTGAFQYEVRFTDGTQRASVIIDEVPGQAIYSYTDTYYQNTTEDQWPYYYVYGREHNGNSMTSWTGSGVGCSAKVGPTFDVTYVLNGGINNPDNPEYVRGNTYYALNSPTPPVGYKFGGWYTSPTFEWDERVYYLDEAREYTLYAKYEPINYYVQFDGNGFTSGNITWYSLTYDKAWTIPLNSTTFKLARTGWMFTGWNTKADGTGISFADGETVKNLTTTDGDTVWLYAQWAAIRYNITFDAAGGAEVATVKKLAYNEQYGTMPTTTRDGYDFAGWYTAASGGSRITADSLFTVQKNQILYARWTPKTYTLSFEDPEGHNVTADKTVTYTANYGTLPTPARTGYNFAGWYLGDDKIVATSKVNTIGDHTLIAHWTPKTPRVTFNGNGGTVPVANMLVEYDANYGKNGNLPVPVRPNYVFTDWYTEAVGGDAITESLVVNRETDHTLYAHWRGVESTVSFDLMCDDAELKPTSPEINAIRVEYSKTYGEALNIDDTPAGGLKKPERSGYTFVGWYTSTDYTTRISDTSTVNITTDATLYAQWEADIVEVTFVPGNGSEPFEKSLVYGGFYEMPETPLKRGYSFAGWYTKAYDPEDPDNKGELKDENSRIADPDSHTLYGHWNANEYTIDFMDEDGTSIASTGVTFDAPITGTIPALWKEGYVFAGWSLSGDPDNVIDIDLLKLRYGYDRSITLTACFVPRTDITVTFDPAGGTLSETSWTVTYKTLYESDSRVLPVPAKEHFEFAGWFTKPEGDEDARRIGSTSTVDIGEDHKLYAHWALCRYNVVFKLEGGYYSKIADATGREVTLDSVSYKISYNKPLKDATGYTGEFRERLISQLGEDADIEIPDPFRAKYEFSGWYDAPAGGAEYDFEAPITRDTYIYAHWTAKEDIEGENYKVAAPEAYLFRDKADKTEGDVISETTLIGLFTSTADAKIYYIAGPEGEDLAADLGTYLNDRDKQDRLTLYTGEIKTSDVMSVDDTDPENISRTVTIRAIAVKDGYPSSDIAVFTYTVEDPELNWGDITDADRIQRFGNDITAVPGGMWISGADEEVSFTGFNITFPDMKVYDAKRVLSQGTDYTVTYKNNKNAGTAVITVTGKGNYAGTFTQNFTILPKNLSDGNVTAKDIKLAYTGKAQLAAPVITYENAAGTVTLKAGTDFTAFYPHTNAKEKTGENAYDADAFKVSGDYEVTVTGKGNYTGTLTYKETILASGVKPVTALTVSVAPARQAYTGAPVVPTTLKVLNGKTELRGVSAEVYETLTPAEKEETDYTYEYFDNIAVGKARILIKGVSPLYDGEKEVNFEITGTNIATAKLTGSDAKKLTYQYDGTEILPAVGSDDPENNINLYYDATKTAPRKDLVYDHFDPDDPENDYFVTYNSNVKDSGYGSAVGKATIVLTGNPLKGYTGSKTITYTITAVNLANDAKPDNLIPLISVTDGGIDFTDIANHEYPYTKGGVTPEPVVRFKTGDGAGEWIVLRKNVDYTLSYLNNTAVNDGANVKKLPTVRITGKGNFTGMRAVDNFMIIPSGSADTDLSLSGLKMSAADVSFANKKNNFVTTVTVTDVNGKNLAVNTDYDRNFEYRLAEEVQFADGRIYPAGYVLTNADTVPAGTRIKVTVTAKGSYAGHISAEYRVVGADISKASVTIANQYFTGYEIRPDKSKINVVFNRISLSPEDYVITGYDNNINKGTGHIYIKGVGNYGGVKTVNFNIVTKPMGYTVVFNGNGSTSGAMAAQTIAAGKQAALTPNKFARTGFSFAGWTSGPDGSRDSYADKAVVSNPGTERAIVLKLYAKWIPTEYTITYHMGGGINNPLNIDCPSGEAGVRYGRKTDGTLYYTAATASFKLEAPLREDWPAGYQFGGFYKENTYKTRIFAINRGTTGNIDLYAKWVPYNYTVSFDGNGADKGAMDSEAFSYGITKAVNANKFTRSGYVFMGWALSDADADAGAVAIPDKAAVDERAFKLTPVNNVNGKATLYAVWRNIFTVDFNLDGGELPVTTEADTGLTNIADLPDSGDLYEYAYGAVYKLPTPVRAGYTFTGWFTDAALKTKLASIAKNKSGDIVLYAKWTPHKYTIVFNGNGSTGGKTANKAFTRGTQDTLNANAFTKKGFKFDSWNTAADGSGTTYADCADIGEADWKETFAVTKTGQTVTLYAKWTPVEYRITYERNGGKLNPDYANYIATYEYDHVIPGDTKGGYELPIPNRKGFTFLGWYRDPAFRTKVTRINRTDFGDMTLYAKWGMKYKVSFDANAYDGGIGTMADQICSYEVSTALRGNTFKNTSGKVFMGWAVSATAASAGNVTYTNAEKLLNPDISAMTFNDATGMYEITLYAVWRNKFAVIFNTDGGTLPAYPDVEADTGLTCADPGEPDPHIYEYTYGSAYALPTPVREGYTFAGWFEDPLFKKKVASISKTVSGDKVLYAKYTGMKYSVTFNSDAPSDPAGIAKRKTTGATRAQSLVYMTPAKLSLCGFKLPGYTFLGWSTKDYEARVAEYALAAGESDIAAARIAYDLDPSADVEYTNAESVEDIMPDGETTPVYEAGYVLYAVWQKDVYVITYQNMAGIDNPNVITYTVDDEVVFNEPEKMGDTFLGWYTDAGLRSKAVRIAKGSTGNRSIYAKFANNRYTINYVLNDADGPAALLDTTHVGYITTYDMDADSGYLLASATREGYDFAGWFTDARLTRPAGPVIAPPSVDMTVYAKWVKKN